MTFNHSLLGRNAEHCPRNSNEMCVHIFAQKQVMYRIKDILTCMCSSSECSQLV